MAKFKIEDVDAFLKSHFECSINTGTTVSEIRRIGRMRFSQVTFRKFGAGQSSQGIIYKVTGSNDLHYSDSPFRLLLAAASSVEQRNPWWRPNADTVLLLLVVIVVLVGLGIGIYAATQADNPEALLPWVTNIVTVLLGFVAGRAVK